MTKPDRAHDARRIPNFPVQPSPFPPMSMSNSQLGSPVFTAAQQRDEATHQLHAKYMQEAVEGNAEREAAHEADKERNR